MLPACVWLHVWHFSFSHMLVWFLAWSRLWICPYWKLISNGRCLWHPWKVALAELWCWQHWNCCNLFRMGTRLIFDLDLLVDMPIWSFTWRCLWQNSDANLTSQHLFRLFCSIKEERLDKKRIKRKIANVSLLLVFVFPSVPIFLVFFFLFVHIFSYFSFY